MVDDYVFVRVVFLTIFPHSLRHLFCWVLCWVGVGKISEFFNEEYICLWLIGLYIVDYFVTNFISISIYYSLK